MTKPMGYGLVAVLACALLAGCGGGDGEPTVTQTVHDELQAELQAEIDAALAALAQEKTARDTAEAEVVRLRTQLATAAERVATLETNLAAATEQATTLNADVTRLAGELETANADVTRLKGELETANASVGSLTTQLTAARANVATLTDSVDDALGEVTRLTGELATANGEVTRLTGALRTANNRVDELETLIGDAINPSATSLRGQLASEEARADQLVVDLAAARARITALTGDLEDAEAEAAAERRRAEQAARDAQAEIQRQIREQAEGLEASQRAQNFRAAFPGGGSNAALTAIPAPAAPLAITPNRGSLRITRGGHGAGTISGSGMRSTTLNLTSGGDTGKTVVYTDRELSRPLLEHFGSVRNATDVTMFDLNPPIALPTTIPHFTTTPPSTTVWRIAHSAATSVTDITTDTDNDGTTDAIQNNTRTAASVTGYLHGLPGRFVCAGGTNCQVQVVPAYAGTPVNNRYALQNLAITATSGTLHFRPNAGSTLQLYQGGPVGPDTEYMAFGYWREDPTNAAGAYQFNVFAEAFASASAVTAGFTGTATYDGIAVGAYVEHDPNDPVDTYRQGEFTADVFLQATATPVALSTTSGTIDDFVTTPTGGSAAPSTAGRWVLTLVGGGTVQLNLAGGGANTEGNWTVAPVSHHASVANASSTPNPAVTGVFNARINNPALNSVHLTGAYGAEVRQ